MKTKDTRLLGYLFEDATREGTFVQKAIPRDPKFRSVARINWSFSAKLAGCSSAGVVQGQWCLT